MDHNRRTGKSYRAVLSSLLIASEGNDVELVVYDRGSVMGTLETLVRVNESLSGSPLDKKPGSLGMISGSTIYVTTLKNRLDTKGRHEFAVVLDVV